MTEAYLKRPMQSHVVSKLKSDPPMPVNRDPCRRCGTRADYGCAHIPAAQILTDPRIADKAWDEAIDRERARIGFLDVLGWK